MILEENEESFEYFYDPNYLSQNPLNSDSLKYYFLRSPFAHTPGYSKENLDLKISEPKPQFFVIIKNVEKEKCIDIYYCFLGRVFKSYSLQAIMENFLANITAEENAIIEKIQEFVEWNLWQKEEKETECNQCSLKPQFY